MATNKSYITFTGALLVWAKLAIPPSMLAQGSAPQKTRAPQPMHKAQRVYEDDEIRLRIPKGWRLVPQMELERSLSSLSLTNPEEGLVLQKNRFVLGLAYHTSQASGIIGGRFIEIFNIPWPGLEDAWTCSLYFRAEAEPVSRTLLFINLIVDSGDEKVRENCAVPKALGSWIEKDGRKESDQGDRRWFGGYFTTEEGGYFFGDNENGCGQKAYRLTAIAARPEQLPIANIPGQGNNLDLEKVIQEAIDIVNSIHYKRCSQF